ncbi:MAG: chalcone isomerase family protein [Myxococcota bacterium]|nr:chalcone isomerase family protein [Myxococcota bacterium]
MTRAQALGGLVLAMLLLSPTLARAGKAEVGMPQTLRAGSASLVLNGSAVRKKLFLKIYELGVYLPSTEADAETIIQSGGPKAVRLRLLIPVDGETIGSSIARGFERNDGHRLEQLGDRLQRLKAMFPAVRRGDDILLRWAPGEGTVVELRGRRIGSIPGKDFADALFAVWLGAVPADAEMKERLLGGKKGRAR